MQCKTLILLAAPFALSACLAQSDIQAKYMKSQENCRGETARSLAAYEGNVPAQGTPSIATRFAECMNKAGWHLATPKPAVVVANPPSGSPSTDPIASLSRAPAGSTASIAPSEGTATMARSPNTVVANPPSGAPSVNPSAAAARAPAPQQAVVYPPSGAPSVNPSAAAARQVPANNPTEIPTTLGMPTSPAPTSSPVYIPSYGTGPGRQF